MALSVDVISLIGKLETFCRTIRQRKGIAEDNRQRFSRLEFKVRMVRGIMQELETQTLNVIREKKLDYFRTVFAESHSELHSLQQDVRRAGITDRVRRMEQLLRQLEAEQAEFEEFLATIVLSKPDKHNEGVISDLEYKSASNVRPNPPHLTLDYNSTDTCEGQLKAAILDQLGTRIIGVIATGQGGTGKTRALRGLATDEDMKTAFPG